jgi:antitoxin component of MazEF toxin-antitoxin module
MVVRVRKVGDEFTAVIPLQIADELGLVDGSELEIGPATGAGGRTTRYATTDEALRAFEDTLPQHEAAYRELAK